VWCRPFICAVLLAPSWDIGLAQRVDQFTGTRSTGIVLFGLRFSDGSCYRNLDERGSAGHLGGLQGGSRGFTGYRDFWAPLPPPGDLELWAAWPAAQIAETRTVLDGSLIGDSAAALRPPWE